MNNTQARREQHPDFADGWDAAMAADKPTDRPAWFGPWHTQGWREAWAQRREDAARNLVTRCLVTSVGATPTRTAEQAIEAARAAVDPRATYQRGAAPLHPTEARAAALVYRANCRAVAS